MKKGFFNIILILFLFVLVKGVCIGKDNKLFNNVGGNMDIKHNGSKSYYEVIKPGNIKIKLFAKGALFDNVFIVYNDGSQQEKEMSYKKGENGCDYYEVVLDLKTKEPYFKYYFILTDKAKKKVFYKKEDPFINFTGNIKNVPSWAKDVVWYQVFPERFCNGDNSNNPTLEETKEGPIENWKIREWGSDWYALDEWEKKSFKSVFESIFKRRYGGDLQGIIDKLDYLQDLGITAIYINPVFRAPSLHKYDGSCFHHIDETLGPDPKGDLKLVKDANETDDPSTWVWTKADKLFLKLLKEAHKRNMKVIIDGVFNHSGRYFFAFEDIIKNGKKSRYVDWYNISEWNSKYPYGFKYKGWFGYLYLPEFKRGDYNVNEGYKKYLFNITKRWMAPFGEIRDGIDGWRLDVAFCLPHGFWKEWRRHVKKINPEAYLTAEVIDIQPDFVRGDEFDAMMNYPFAFTITEYFIDKKNKISPSLFDKRLKELRKAYPNKINYVMQNLMSSHDSPRLRTLIVNPDNDYRDWDNHFDRSKLEKNPHYKIDRGDDKDKAIHKMIVAFQMTYLGAPMIYYGDEVGMTGANDPDCRKPMLWEGISYKDEIAHPVLGSKKKTEKNNIDYDLLNYYRKLIKIRNQNPPLRRGNFKTILVDDKRNIYGFERKYKGQKITVVFNNSNKKQTISLEAPTENKIYIDLIKEKEYQIKDNLLTIETEPYQVVVIK